MLEHAMGVQMFPGDVRRTWQHSGVYLFQDGGSLSIAEQSISQNSPGRLCWSCKIVAPKDHNIEDMFSPDYSTPAAWCIIPSVNKKKIIPLKVEVMQNFLYTHTHTHRSHGYKLIRSQMQLITRLQKFTRENLAVQK